MVNRYLYWHHTNLRAGEALIFVDVIAPVLGISLPPEKVALAGDTFLRSLSTLVAN